MKTFDYASAVIVVTQCPFCGKAHEVLVNEEDYLDWEDGELAQNAFPYLSADEREMLISGICPSCWRGMFGGEDEEDKDIYNDYLGNVEVTNFFTGDDE
jgi:hypothetical protein